MNYNNIRKGIFKERPNRFIAIVEIDGKEEVVHVKNTGRCKEILIPGVTVYLEKSDNPNRKTLYDLVAVCKDSLLSSNKLINIDSQVPNHVVYEWLTRGSLFSEDAIIKKEVSYKNSRFDLYVEDGHRKIFIEVKGVTLENNGVASFPDAPTVRGVKHINELIECVKEGFEAYIVFVIQMKGIKTFTPNDITHPEFGEALRNAYKNGVNIIAVDCNVRENGLEIDNEIEIEL